MSIAEDRKPMPSIQNPNLTPGVFGDAQVVSQTSSSHPKEQPSPSPVKKLPASPKDAIIAVAARVAAQPLPCSDPEVWGVLTAISNHARKRSQGINILLTADVHILGRLVEDVRFQLESTAVSQRHCEISRKVVPKEDVESPSGFCNSTFLKDTSTNGTYLNWERLKRGNTKFEAKLCHGDIISFLAPPQHEQALAFVYREVLSSIPSSNANVLKRKAEESTPENKRPKGIGLGAPEGPISLDDFRSLQRSNEDLRKQLENQVRTIDELKNENREAVEHHQNEMEELKDSISKPYLAQLNELNESFKATKSKLTEVNKASAEQKHTIEDLNVRVASALQSCTEANEIIESQKTAIAELKTQLDEERDMRKEEREKAAADLKSAVQRVAAEAQEELKRASDVSLRREREQQEVINKFQESEKESSLLVESLRSKLEETRKKLVLSENKIRQLEAQVFEEQQASASRKKRVEELEVEMNTMSRELDKEKAAREEAWAKVSALELEINAAMRDLESERQRLKGAREKIMLRETQLRAFYSTTEEIQKLFSKQQEQLKAMQRTLEDEDNYENDGFSLHTVSGTVGGEVPGVTEATGYKSKPCPSASAQKTDRGGAEMSIDEGSATEKHECDVRSPDDENTQEAQFPNDDSIVKCGFGSDIDGVGTAPICEGYADGTERVLDTESPGVDGERNMDLDKSGNQAGETLPIEYDTNVQETEQEGLCEQNHNQSYITHREESEKASVNPELAFIRTEDLLASEVAGSWAADTGPSVYGDNESLHNDDREAHIVVPDSKSQEVAESQNSALGSKIHSDVERQALSNMIGILAPDVKEQFGNAVIRNSEEMNTEIPNSDSETDDECIQASKEIVPMDGVGVGSDDETQAEKVEDEDVMDEDDDDTQEDSVG
ncbi:uncharacterized protein LOC141586010 isoform X2 [Silene latifolia]|uniref:uncharacterized protein LOC141586010 isoform X2 n=1 Tax=Silene latifolia TaxID=37657 RepID=UPI003D77142D